MNLRKFQPDSLNLEVSEKSFILTLLVMNRSAFVYAAFIDAYDWVMQTNVVGMGQFADGRLIASKPYAAPASHFYCALELVFAVQP